MAKKGYTPEQNIKMIARNDALCKGIKAKAQE